MHVSGGNGRVYRAHFRRDWPTGQAYPNLWPHRIRLDSWNMYNWPSFIWDNFLEVISSVGVISSDGQKITYTWEQSFLLDTATIVMDFRPGPGPLDQHWSWLFTQTTKAGFLLVTSDGYVLDQESSRWQVSYSLPVDHFNLVGVGDFGLVEFAPATSPFIEMYSAKWSEIPMDERF